MKALPAAVVLAGALVAGAACSDSDELGELVRSAAESSTTSEQATTTAEGGAPSTADPEPSTTTAGDGGTGDEVSVFDLDVGDCFDTSETAEVETVEVVPCTSPHGNEVFALFDLEGDEFPGDQVAAELAEEGCIERFEDYVGVEYSASELEVSYLYPLEEGWEQIGDREVVCIASRVDGRDLDEPVEGSGL